jgi:hypothetical protein
MWITGQCAAARVLAPFLADADLAAGERFAAPFFVAADLELAERLAEARFDCRDNASCDAVDLGSCFIARWRLCDLLADGFRPGCS